MSRNRQVVCLGPMMYTVGHSTTRCHRPSCTRSYLEQVNGTDMIARTGVIFLTQCSAARVFDKDTTCSVTTFAMGRFICKTNSRCSSRSSLLISYVQHKECVAIERSLNKLMSLAFRYNRNSESVPQLYCARDIAYLTFVQRASYDVINKRKHAPEYFILRRL